MRKFELIGIIFLIYFSKFYCFFRFKFWEFVRLSCFLILLWFYINVRVLLTLRYLKFGKK